MTMKGLIGCGRRVRLQLLLTAIVGLAVLMVGAQSSRAAGPKALILGSTVTPGNAPDGDSFEQEFAEQLGYTVTVVTDTQWDSMTAAQFASYQLLIFGDPTCGGDPTNPTYQAAQNNMAVWEPVVMASGGNKVLIGTDPVFHEADHPGALTLIKQGLQFAGAVSGATGVYLDLSCSYDSTPANTPVPILDGLSTHGPHQFTAIGEGAVNACATGVNIVAATGPTAGLTDADLSDWSCSVHEAFDHFPSDYTPLALAPSGSGFPVDYCANDVETHKLACGSPYIMVSGGGVTVSSDISLSAAPSTQDVGGQVTLTATVTSSGKPVSGTKVTFNVDSGPNTGVTGSAVTDANGHASFTYTGSKGAGTDSDSATFTNSIGAQEKGTTTVNWTPAITASAGANLSGTEGNAVSGTVATFSDADSNASASEYSATINWGDGTTSAGTISGTPSQFNVTGGHTYAEEGSFTITVTITDVDNSANHAVVSEKAIISDAALHATGVVPTLSGTTASGKVATFTDSDAGGTVSDYTASINWGDGTTTTGTVSKSGSGFAVSGSHDYGKSGTFTITTTIKDAGGASAKATVTIAAQVKAAKVKRGSAHLAAVPNACVRGSFTMQIRGAQIASVRVTLGGRTKHARAVHRGTLYTARIAVPAGRHTVTVHVKFKPASRTKALTLHRAVAGCAVPAFTG